MQTRNKFFDDMSQMMTNAMGVAQGAKEEAENAIATEMAATLYALLNTFILKSFSKILFVLSVLIT